MRAARRRRHAHKDIQAGFLIRGIPYSGVHGRAGSIGEMLTGPDNVRLNTVVGVRIFP